MHWSEEIAKKIHELEQTGIKNNAELEKRYKIALIKENAKLAKEREENMELGEKFCILQPPSLLIDAKSLSV